MKALLAKRNSLVVIQVPSRKDSREVGKTQSRFYVLSLRYKVCVAKVCTDGSVENSPHCFVFKHLHFTILTSNQVTTFTPIQNSLNHNS
jgi:hypothetical protein